jgi:hypothetical protein
MAETSGHGNAVRDARGRRSDAGESPSIFLLYHWTTSLLHTRLDASATRRMSCTSPGSSKPCHKDAMRGDQAKATGGANRPPPNDPLARSVSQKTPLCRLRRCLLRQVFRPGRQQDLFSYWYQFPKIPSLQSSTSGRCAAWTVRDSTDRP